MKLRRYPEKYTMRLSRRSTSSTTAVGLQILQSLPRNKQMICVDYTPKLIESIDCVDLDFLRTHYTVHGFTQRTKHNTLYTVRVRPSLLSANSRLIPYLFVFVSDECRHRGRIRSERPDHHDPSVRLAAGTLGTCTCSRLLRVSYRMRPLW